MQQIHVYKRHYFNHYHDHIQTLEATFYLDNSIYHYLSENWDEQRFNALCEYEVRIPFEEYEKLSLLDDTGMLNHLFKDLMEDEECYLAIY